MAEMPTPTNEASMPLLRARDADIDAMCDPADNP